MFLASSADRWHWSEDVSPALDFGVWLLLQDGLRVPPFDQHPEGDGRLRDLGLDGDSWQRWMSALAEQYAVLSQSVRTLAAGEGAEGRAAGVDAAAVLLGRPSAVCPGTEKLRAAIDRLWVLYEPVGEARRRSRTACPETKARRGSAADQRRLWHSLLPFHERLPTISIFLVSYPDPVVMAVSATACLIAPGSGPVAYGRQVRAAAEVLAASA